MSRVNYYLFMSDTSLWDCLIGKSDVYLNWNARDKGIFAMMYLSINHPDVFGECSEVNVKL